MKDLLLSFCAFLARSRRLRLYAVFMVSVLLLHHLGVAWMAESRAVERFMSGSIPGFGMGVAVFGFIVLRMTAILLLPGLFLSCLLSDLLCFLDARHHQRKG